MNHGGFKGTRVGVSKVEIGTSTLTYEILFVDQDGVTHGMMRHSIPLDGESAISKKAEELSTLLIDRAARIHFSRPSGVDASDPFVSGESSGGIGEALGATGTPSDEPVGSQG